VIDAVFGPIGESISDMVDSYLIGVRSALKMAEMDTMDTGTVGSSTPFMFSDTLNGGLDRMLLGIATIIDDRVQRNNDTVVRGNPRSPPVCRYIRVP